MAGKNKIYKENEVLFEEGAANDGMYILRSGKLKIYQIKEEEEILFAYLEPGAILGEMAFFENKPRSASAKAVMDSEVTVIDLTDFKKLLKQIPGWFVIMMRSLSARLRQTNEKLKEVSQGNVQTQKFPLHNVTKITTVISLICHKMATKQDKEFLMNLTSFKLMVEDVFNEDFERIKKVIDIFIKYGFLKYGQDTYKNEVIIFNNRPLFYNFVEFLQKYALEQKNADICLSPPAFSLLEMICKVSKEATYESMTLTVSNLRLEAEKDEEINTEGWEEAVDQLVENELVKKVSTSGDDVGIRCGKKDVQLFLKYQQMIRDFVQEGLA